MSSFNLGKKLPPVKKAWKSFTNMLQSRCHKLKLSKSIKRSKNLCIRAYNYIHPIVARKFYSFINRSPRWSRPRTQRQFYHYYRYQQFENNVAAIYIDQLFPEPAVTVPARRRNHSSTPEKRASSSNGCAINIGSCKLDHQEEQQMIRRDIDQGKSVLLTKGKALESTTCDAQWTIPSLQHISGVDRRAEEFISKFREDMELERQQSILDFHEMLARGT